MADVNTSTHIYWSVVGDPYEGLLQKTHRMMAYDHMKATAAV